MSGIIIEPATSIDAIERNFSRLNEAVVALQGGSISMDNISGYENLATKLYVEQEMETVRYAVGDVHITEDEENPADKFGYGEWRLMSRGRALVGIDVEPDKDDPDYDPEYEVDQDFQAIGQEGGEKEHTLTIDELPNHRHGYESLGPGGRHVDGTKGDLARSGKTGYQTGQTGLGQPHNNLQPYYCVYIWRRIK